jgi:hypothetical protein
MSEYRAYIVGTDGHIARTVQLVCPDEETAKNYARQLVDGHDVELWQDERIVETFDRSSAPDRKTIMPLPSGLDAYEAVVDDAIASCDGDLRGALKALIIANEFLERDLQEALTSGAAPSIANDGDSGLTPVNWMDVRKLARIPTGKP